ncbi:DNA packaging protein [Yersinia enterocolitica]|nr:DNA packaging protein [Yersinia enterocolitica]HEI6830332.1 DNA packaging protein [Yersinia enterocolitica]
MATEEKKTGRPTDYLPEVGEDICNLLMLGESLRSICKRPGMPAIRTVMYWLQRYDDFMQQYARAREIQAELLAEEIITIADDSSGDVIVDEDGKEQTNHERVARSRLRVDARKWYASKLAPKRYGERVQHDQKITITDLTDEELDRRLQELQDAQSQPGRED